MPHFYSLSTSLSNDTNNFASLILTLYEVMSTYIPWKECKHFTFQILRSFIGFTTLTLREAHSLWHMCDDAMRREQSQENNILSIIYCHQLIHSHRNWLFFCSTEWRIGRKKTSRRKLIEMSQKEANKKHVYLSSLLC